MSLSECLGLVAPYYNMALVFIVVILFVILFKKADKEIFIKPWKLLFIAILIYIVEQILAILEISNMLILPAVLFPILETLIIMLFIYMLLTQKEYVKNETVRKK